MALTSTFLIALAACAAPATSSPGAATSASLTALERVRASERIGLGGELSEAEAILWPGLRQTRQASGPGAAADRARLLVQLGRVRTSMIWRWDIRPDLAADPLDEALSLAERSGDADLRADAHDALGMLAYTVKLFRREGEWDAIDGRFARALGLARDDRRRATIRFHLGLVRQMRGDLARAEEQFTASLSLARAAGADQVAGEDLRHLAYLAGVRGDRARAIELHGESLRLRQKIGNPPGEATAHLALGQLHLEAGDRDAARHHLERAYQLARRFGLGYAQVAAAASLARLEARAGRGEQARSLAARAMLLARHRRDDQDLTQAHLAAAEVSAALGQTEPARAHLEEARRAAARTDDDDLARECDDTARRLGLGSQTAPASRR